MKTHVRVTWKRNSATALFTALILGGCLSGDGEDISFLASTDSGNAENSVPRISGSPPTGVTIGDTYSFTPSASDADGDSLTFSISGKPSWAGFETSNGCLSGDPAPGDVGLYSNIVISVSDDAAAVSLAAFSISVEAISNGSTTLDWTAPTENEDGTVLTDLSGYKLYWGTAPGDYTDSVTIDNPSVTTYVVENLSPGTYEFVATAYNSASVESHYSQAATRVVD